MTTTDRTRPAISATGLRKSFGAKVVLDGIDLTVARGHDLRAARPQRRRQDHDGADPVHPDPRRRRRVRVAGHDLAADPDAVRAAIGVTGQFSAVDNLLTGEENLLLMADLHHLGRAEGRRRAAALLEQFDLADAASKPAATYSGGMRRRLDLAMTLVGDPRLIFLDEPTTGLDPRSRHAMWQIIRDLAADGVTIFLTTQYLEEADQLADRIAVLDQGRIVAEGTPAELKRRIPGGHIQPAVRRPGGARLGGRRRSARRPGTTRRSPCRSPATAASESLRALLDRLDERRSRSTACRSTPPISTTSSSPSPATPATEGRQPAHEHPAPYTVTDSATMLRRNLRHMLRYPSMTLMLLGMPIIFLLLFVYVFGGTLGAGLGGLAGGRAAYVGYVAPGILLLDRGGGGPGHRDLGRHGHDRGHHRPVPHHGHRPSVGAHRARPRQRHPDAARRRCRHRCRRADRLPAQRGPARLARARSASSP